MRSLKGLGQLALLALHKPAKLAKHNTGDVIPGVEEF